MTTSRPEPPTSVMENVPLPDHFADPTTTSTPPFRTAEGLFQAEGGGDTATDRISPLSQRLSDATNDKPLRETPSGAQILADDYFLPVETQKAGYVGEERRSGISGGGGVARDNIIGTSPASGRLNRVEGVAVSGGRAGGRVNNVGRARGMENTVGAGSGVGRGRRMAKTK